MNEVVMSMVSLIILVPIIYFLPLGLTSKGKGVIILVSFILAIIGILAHYTFSTWQTGLILLLLTLLTVYILGKRLGKFMFVNKTENEIALKLPKDFIEEIDEVDRELETRDTKEPVSKKNTQVYDEHRIVETIYTSGLEEFSFERTKENEENLEENPSLGDTKESVLETKVDDEAVLFLGKETELKEKEHIVIAEEAWSKEYLSEIEMLLQSDELDDKDLTGKDLFEIEALNFENNKELINDDKENNFQEDKELDEILLPIDFNNKVDLVLKDDIVHEDYSMDKVVDTHEAINSEATVSLLKKEKDIIQDTKK